MTIGIYKLSFQGTDKCYIGQSVNIPKRFREHLRNLQAGTSTYKLQEGYNKYGIPTLEVVTECQIDELDSAEDEIIEIFDSCNNGFNIYSRANEAPTYSGYGYGNSKYSRDQVEGTISLLLNKKDLTYAEISSITKVEASTVSNLAHTYSHPWFWEMYPDKKMLMQESLASRTKTGRNAVSTKLSAKSRGIDYPLIKCPSGNVYKIDNAYAFAKANGLAPNHFQEVLNGHRKSHKGWKLV